MGATAETIWRMPAYLPYLQPPLTDAAVASAEEQLGYKLPVEYLDLLRKQNGDVPDKSSSGLILGASL